MFRSVPFLLGAVVLVACAKASETTFEDDEAQGGSSVSSGGAGATAQGPMTSGGAMGGMATTGGSGGTGPGCGDGVQDPGEGCDDGNQSNDDSCPDDPNDGGTCQPATCGDGFVWSTDGGSETCDDGNGSDNDDCPDGAAGACVDATCDDGLWHNQGTGDEEDVDCGGSCPACPSVGLMLSEIVVTPTGAEMIEIHNPTWTDIPLDDVYLADYPAYYQITTGGSAPGQYDFRVRFPAGSVIAAGGHIVVSTQSAADFQTEYGFAPDFDFDSGDAGAPAMLGEIDAEAGLSNGDEMVVLFFWDGTSDLVADVDYVVWGDTSEAMDKSGVTVGAGTYASETSAATQSVAVAPVSTMSVAHCIYTEGAEVKTGGNGVSGHDETSEDLANTWESVSPTPGTFNNCPVIVAPTKDAGVLYHFDRVSFAELDAVPITTSIFADGITSLARHPSTGVTYAVLNDVFLAERTLAFLNVATGDTETIATFTVQVSAIAFADNGTLYGIVGDGDFFAADELGTIDLTTGAFTTVHTYPDLDDGEALAFNPLTGLLHRFSGNTTPSMLQVDVVGLNTTPIAWSGTEPSEPCGAFWDPDLAELVLFDTGFDVHQVNPDGTIVDTTYDVPERIGGALIP